MNFKSTIDKYTKVYSKLFFTFIIAALLLPSCSKDDAKVNSPEAEKYSAGFLYDYFDLICQTTKNTPGFFPPQAARAYGYIGLANYEAVRNGIEGAISMQDQLNGFKQYAVPQPDPNLEYNWAIVSNAATAKMIRYMYDKNLTTDSKKAIDDMELENHTEFAKSINAAVASRSKDLGYAIADKVFEYSKTDNGHESYLDPFQKPYTIPTDLYCWVPTGAVTTPLSPKWGLNRPFMEVNIDRTKVSMPVAFSESKDSEFYKQALATYNQVKNNSTEEIEIAKYWADDPFATCTPTGHTFNILTQILLEEKATLAKASIGYAKMGIAENDAFIACWKGKYDHVLLRPVTYINRYIDPNFKTLLGTPPFPAYTSGHSCEMGAGSRVLSSLFTDGSGNYQFTDYSQLRYNFYARSFSNFERMAEECANSRLYGGIHYPMDNSKGLQIGRAIGDNVNKRLKWPPFVR
jgi:hypothetical protein